MTSLLAALLVAAVESASPQGPETKLGVVCLGPDASAAGDLQRVLELRLNALKEVGVVGASVLAEKVGAAVAPPIVQDAALEKEARELLGTVRDAYYRNDAPRALESSTRRCASTSGRPRSTWRSTAPRARRGR